MGADHGIGGQLLATGGQITVEVLSTSTNADSELRPCNADGTFTPIVTNRQLGHPVTLPARLPGGELVPGIFVPPHRAHPAGLTFKMGPGDRNPDGIVRAKVTKIAEVRSRSASGIRSTAVTATTTMPSFASAVG